MRDWSDIADEAQRTGDAVDVAVTRAVKAETERCVKAALSAIRHSQQTVDQCRAEVEAAIRTKETP